MSDLYGEDRAVSAGGQHWRAELGFAMDVCVRRGLLGVTAQ